MEMHKAIRRVKSLDFAGSDMIICASTGNIFHLLLHRRMSVYFAFIKNLLILTKFCKSDNSYQSGIV